MSSLDALLLRRVDAWANDVREGLGKRTLQGYLYLLALLPASGIHTLRGLTRENLQRHIRERREKDEIGAATAKKIHVAALSFSNWLEQNGEIPLDQYLSLKTIKIKQPVLPPPRFLTREEYVRLIVAARASFPILSLAVQLAVHTGLRMNELRCLHHEDIFLDAAEPYVRVVRGPTDADTRRLKNRVRPRMPPPISMGFTAELRRLCIGQPRTGPIFPAGGHAREARHSSSPYVGHKALERWMSHAREAAGLGDDVTFITLRHTYASWLTQAGVSLAKVAKWMDHSIAICWKHYAALAPGGDRDVDKGFAQKTPPRVTLVSEIPTPPWGHTPPLGAPKA